MTEIDVRKLIPIVAEMINGKGGGRPALVEIAGNNPEKLEAASGIQTFLTTTTYAANP